MSSAAISVASYAFVLGGTLAAVTTSSAVPAALVAAARALKRSEDALPGAVDAARAELTKAASDLFDMIPAASGGPMLKKAIGSVDSLLLLVPKTAQVEAEFTLEGREVFEGGVSAGAQLQAVTVSAGYSALFEQTSGFKVRMTIDFAAVDFPLDGPPA